MTVIKIKQNEEWIKLPNIGVTNYNDSELKATINQLEKIEYNISQDKNSTYPSLTEAIAAVDNEKYKVKGIVLTFNTGKEWISMRYNGEDVSGWSNEDNWIEVCCGGSVTITEKLTITLSSNQAQPDAALNGAKVTITYLDVTKEYTWDGSEIVEEIPLSVKYTITFGEIQGYSTPESKTFTSIAGNVRNVSASYNTEVVTVTLRTYDSASVSGQNVTINSKSYPYTDSPIVAKVPFSTEYGVSVDAKEGYGLPKEQRFTANQATRNVEVVYESVPENIITINQTISDPNSMVGGDVNGEVIQWIRANSHRVLAKKTAEGKVTYCRLKDDDSTKYHDGSTANLTGTEGDVFVKLPTFYYYGTEGDNVELHFAKEKLDDNYIEWDTNILIGVYESYNNGGKAYSRSGVESTGSISQRDWGTYAAARGKGYQRVDWQMHCVLGCLYYAMYGNTDCQSTIGKGTNSYQKINGETDALGMTDTVAGGNGDSGSINFWGLENWWGNKYEWMEEDQVNPSAKQFTVYDPVTKGTRNIPFKYFNGWYVKKMKFGRYLDLINTEDDDQRATDSTSYCDYQYWPDSGSTRVVQRSGLNSSTDGGVAFAYADNDSSGTNSYSGSRLAFRGECTEAESVAAFKALPNL